MGEVERRWEIYVCPACGKQLLGPTDGCVDGHVNTHAEALEVVPAARIQWLEEERNFAIAHDRQPYPTADAYEKACAALEKHRDRAEKAEAHLAEAVEEGKRLREGVEAEVDGFREVEVAELAMRDAARSDGDTAGALAHATSAADYKDVADRLDPLLAAAQYLRHQSLTRAEKLNSTRSK